AHPVGNWLLQMGFDLWIRMCYDREVVMPENFALAPGSLIASNHQRDVDGPMLGLVLARRRGFRFQGAPPFYATREDLFRPGILSRLTVHWPAPLSAVLGHISLAWFFPLGRTEPMRRVREFTLGETLHALMEAGLGEADCNTLLNARGQRELATGHAKLADCIDRAKPATLEGWWGLRRLKVAALQAIAPAFRATVDAQLAHFARRVDRGCCVYFSPEGTISMDGHCCRTRAGFFRLVHLTAQTPHSIATRSTPPCGARSCNWCRSRPAICWRAGWCTGHARSRAMTSPDGSPDAAPRCAPSAPRWIRCSRAKAWQASPMRGCAGWNARNWSCAVVTASKARVRVMHRPAGAATRPSRVILTTISPTWCPESIGCCHAEVAVA